MVNFKKFLACALVATMVFGSSITAFADDPDPNTGTATVTGSGTSEGHVDKEKMNFVLPTTDATTFAYTMDPERLIQATNAAAHSGMTFPAAASDTGVYFQTSTTAFANTSNTVNCINKGSADATLTVKVKTGDPASTDIALATAALTEADNAAGGTPKLYLAANVGGKTAILSGTEQTVTAVVPGNASNYEVVYENNAYAYKVKASGLTAWKAIAVNVTGAVTNGLPIASTTTAPQVSFTWSFAKKGTSDASTEGVSTIDYSETPVVTDAAPSIAVTEYNFPDTTDDVLVAVNLGAGDKAATGIEKVLGNSGTALASDGSRWTFDEENNNVAINGAWLKQAGDSKNSGDSIHLTIVFNDEDETEVQLTIIKE